LVFPWPASISPTSNAVAFNVGFVGISLQSGGICFKLYIGKWWIN
jgi:hypothetical protein